MLIRIFSLLSLLFFVLVFPWWLAFILVFALVFLLEDFYEAVLPFLVFDLLYGLAPDLWFKPPFSGTLFVLSLLLLSGFVKERVAFFKD